MRLGRVMMEDGKATGIEYIDAVSKQTRDVRAKIVILCASTLESTRLLMNSGICNSSGVLGKYLMDHIYQGGASGIMPKPEAKAWVGMPRRPNGIYIPRFRNVKEKRRTASSAATAIRAVVCRRSAMESWFRQSLQRRRSQGTIRNADRPLG